MKLSDALSNLVFYRYKHNVPYTVAVDVTTKVAERLITQRTILMGLLVATIGYGITLTWIASELVHENQQLIYDLNVSQTAFHIQSANSVRLQYRIDELKTANTCMLKVLDKKSCNKAIRNTPLPKMVKEAR